MPEANERALDDAAIRKLVDEAPPLTEEQRSTFALIFRGVRKKKSSPRKRHTRKGHRQ